MYKDKFINALARTQKFGLDVPKIKYIDGTVLTNELQRKFPYLLRGCNDRLKLLARQYAENLVGDEERSVQARIEMIESEIDSTIPRYNEKDWQLLKEFQDSLEWLNEEK